MQKPEDYARGAEAVVKRGFTAVKYDPVPGPWRTFVPKEHIRRAVKVMRAVRDAVGPDVDMLLDIHRRLAPMHAIDLANALAEFEPYWFEEPCQSENVEALAEVRRASRIPVVTGEALYARSDFRPILRERAVDIINPDVSNCGGILELMYHRGRRGDRRRSRFRRTTTIRRPWRSPPPCTPRPACRTSSSPNTSCRSRSSARGCCPNVLKPVNGYIALPEGPGLGLTVDETGRCARRRDSSSRPELPAACRRKGPSEISEQKSHHDRLC